jgi:hypothetical protein
MITSAQCRLYAKKSQLLGKTLDVSFRRRDQAMIMALRWSRLADQIDRDDATTAPEWETTMPRHPLPPTCLQCNKPMRFMLVKKGAANSVASTATDRTRCNCRSWQSFSRANYSLRSRATSLTGFPSRLRPVYVQFYFFK